MIKIKKIYVFISIFFVFLINDVYSVENINIEADTHSPSVISLNILNGTPPFEIYKGTDAENYTYIMDINGFNYKEYGLSSGVNYWYKIVDSKGNYGIANQSIPFTNISILPLQLTELGDNYVNLQWSNIYSSVDLYVNGVLWEKNIKHSSITVSDLLAGKDYVFYYTNVSGVRSNSIRVTTSKDLDNLINRLDTLLTKLFVSDRFKIDSDNDGIVDGMEGLYNKGQEIINTPGIKYPSDIGGIIEDSKNNISTPSIEEDASALDNLPKLEVEFVPGYKINIFNLEPFIKEIKLIRFVLVCMLYVDLFFYFVTKLIPSLDV